MTYTPTKVLTFDEFIVQYGDNPRYELIDGELRDMEPTGPVDRPRRARGTAAEPSATAAWSREETARQRSDVQIGRAHV